MTRHTSLVITAALFVGLLVLLTKAQPMGGGFDDGEGYDDPEEEMMRRAEGMPPREKVTIGVLSRPNTCNKKITEGSKAAIHLTLSKIVPSETKAGETEKVEVFRDKPKLIIAGSGRFIEGIESGLIGACPGEKRSIRIPASLGFAEDGNKKLNIPPETELRAVVSVEDVEDPDPYGEDMDDMSPDEDMEIPEGGREEGGEPDDDEDGEDAGGDSELTVGPSIPEEDFLLHVRKVDEASFRSLQAKSNVFVMFFAPWCGHCTAVKPKFAQVARAFKGESKIAVVAVDATEEEGLASEFGIEGFPTFFLIKQGDEQAPVKYTQARTTTAMVQAVNEAFGTDRLPNGRLSEFAGTNPEHNALVDEWHHGTRSLEDLTKNLPEGSYYRRVCESIQSHGKEYVAKEKQRLEKMLTAASASVKVEQLDSMQRRINILNVFHDERHGQ